MKTILILLALAACSKHPYPTPAASVAEAYDNVLRDIDAATAADPDCHSVEAALGRMTLDRMSVKQPKLRLEQFLRGLDARAWNRYLDHDYKPRYLAAVAALAPVLDRCKLPPLDELDLVGRAVI